jgi:hypothetical protein
MFSRFAIGYLGVGLLVSALLNLSGAIHGTGSAFEWSSSVLGTTQHFATGFLLPIVQWPVIVYKVGVDMFSGTYTSWF